MSLQSVITTALQRIATEFNTVRAEIAALGGGGLPATCYGTRQGGTTSYASNWQKVPVNIANVLLTSDSAKIEMTSNGTFTVKVAGHYQCEGLISYSNMPSGTTKFVFGVRKNGSLAGYLVRGFATLSSADYWGTSGNFSLQCSANDTIEFYAFLGKTFSATGVYLQVKVTELGT